MNISLACLLILLGFSHSLLSEDAVKSDLLISELTVDTVPGDDGSWIELYNHSDVEMPVQGFTIVCNNQKVFSFPEKTILKPKELILIKFSETQLKSSSSEIIAKPSSAKVKTDSSRIDKRGPIIKHYPIINQRTPGYCALFKSDRVQKEDLLDYVLWGEDDFFKLFPELNAEHNKWAMELGIWKDKNGIYIGINPLLGDVFFDDLIVINRKPFVNDKFNSWASDFLTNATPGEGNKWKTPCFLLCPKDYRIYKGDKMKLACLDFDERIKLIYKPKDIIISLQISKDPHFEEIAFNKHLPNGLLENGKMSEAEIDSDVLPGYGRYFARARIETEKVNTDWTPTLLIIYKGGKKDFEE